MACQIAQTANGPIEYRLEGAGLNRLYSYPRM